MTKFTNKSYRIKGTQIPKPQICTNKGVAKEEDASKDSTPPTIRITLASLDEYNILLQNGLDFYGATFFPTEANMPSASGSVKIATKKGRFVINLP